MSIKANDLDSDLKTFEREDGTVEDSVNADSLDPFLHQSQGDSFEGEETSRVKKFFDYPVLHVFLPWLRALTKGFNALKSTVETKYLKSEKVQEKYDPKSADPMSGKAVAEAIDTVDPEHLREALAAIGGYLEVDELYAMSTVVNVAAAAGGEQDIRCFIFHTAEDKLYFASSVEVLHCILSRETDEETGEETMETLTPILDLSAMGGSVDLPIRKGAGTNALETGEASNKADGARSFVGGNGAIAPGSDSFSFGLLTKARGKHSAAFNSNTEAVANDTFATGEGTYAGSNVQRVAGKFNEKDSEGKYLDIVGNGTSDSDRHNAYTLDHKGNGTFAGDVRSKDGVLAANGTLFPKYAVKAEVDPTAYNDIPSEDAKLILETAPVGIMGTIYLYDPETCEESMMSLREGASYPVTLPDDFADQEKAARLWKPGCQIESIYMDEGTKAYFVYSKEQTDHRAISPALLKELIEEKTIYLPVANHDETFVVTEEMAESGLAVKVWSDIPNDYVYWSLAYNKNGENHGELYGTETFSRGEIPVDVSPYVGYTMHFTFSDQDGHNGLAWLKQPVKVGSVSIEKLTALLSEEVSEE